MSRVENQNNDAKKLALRCKTLEVQLRQSIPKKEHHEVVYKLEREIDSLEKEISRAKADLQKTIALNKQLGAIGEQITAQNKTMGAQGKIVDSLVAKISQGTVPSSIHLQSLYKNRELEEQIRGMVSKAEYTSLERRSEELSRQMNAMVPAAEHSSTKQRLEELESALSSMVPREQLNSSEARAKELEARLAEHVPQSVYDELVSKVVSLAEEVTGGALSPEGPESLSQAEPGDATPTNAVEPATKDSTDTLVQQTPPEAVELIARADASEGDASTPSDNTAPEIREIQSQLAEMTSRANEAGQGNVGSSGSEGKSSAFKFSNTGFVVTTGFEFVRALEKVPTNVLESHVQNGDFEKWFTNALSDKSTAEAFQKIREGGFSGEELRSQVISSVAKYGVAQQPTIRSTSGTA